MGKLTIGCFSSLVGSMTLDFAVKLAEAARKKGHDVDMWLSGNGTMLSKKGQRSFKDYSSLEKTITSLVEGGMNVTACEACAESRGYHKEDVIGSLGRKSMDWYLASCFSADRVLHIGGE
ncbi:MAG: DsrE family protein [Nitrospirae bacterium]|uniref:DsrE family protein n=1 Tax=Candidatus Magnetominusculus dajiuhuensis TaxID=3137712 RepID=UPI0019F06305|nr:DsrE family protein [Nitrospirota bacterium]